MVINNYTFASLGPFNDYPFATELELNSSTAVAHSNYDKDSLNHRIYFDVEFTPEITSAEVISLNLSNKSMKAASGVDRTRIRLIQANTHLKVIPRDIPPSLSPSASPNDSNHINSDGGNDDFEAPEGDEYDLITGTSSRTTFAVL
jgi:hypothetical protein